MPWARIPVQNEQTNDTSNSSDSNSNTQNTNQGENIKSLQYFKTFFLMI